MPHPDHTPDRLALGYRASGLGPEEARAAAEADLAITGQIGPAESREQEAEIQALSAQEYAVWALERVGFTDIRSNGRDPFDGMTACAPCGGLVEIKPLDQVG